MASIGHLMVGLAAGRLQARRPKELAGSMILFAMISVLPDLDAAAFAMGIPYDAPFGHRGAMHSLGMAVIGSAVMALVGLCARLSPWRMGLVTLLTLTLHVLCDAMTDGGLGVALFWPLSNRRFFLPWHPLPVAPIGLAGLLTPQGRHVVAVEVAVFAPFLVYAFWPRRKQKGAAACGAPPES